MQVTPLKSTAGIPSLWGRDAPTKAWVTDRRGGKVGCCPWALAAGLPPGTGRRVAPGGMGRDLVVAGHCPSSVLGPVLLMGPQAGPWCCCCGDRALLPSAFALGRGCSLLW